jgi:hypothetical protein
MSLHYWIFPLDCCVAETIRPSFLDFVPELRASRLAQRWVYRATT